MLRTFEAAFVDLARADNIAVVDAVLDSLRDGDMPALGWARVLHAAARAPQKLANRLVDLFASAVFLEEPETSGAVRAALGQVYSELTPENRAAVEQSILDLTDGVQQDEKELAERLRDRFIMALPAELIIQAELKDIRKQSAEAEAADSATDEQDNVDFDIEAWRLRRQGAVPERPANKLLIDLAQAVRDAPRWEKEKPLAGAEAKGWLSKLETLENALASALALGADAPVIEQSRDYLYYACKNLSTAEGLQANEPLVKFITKNLLEASGSDRPKFDPKEEEQWASESTGWGSPSPRIDAAIGLAVLGSKAETTDAEALNALECLGRDRVAAVRYQVVTRAMWFRETAPDLMWAIIHRVSEEEELVGILAAFANRVLFAMPADEHGRHANAVRTLYRRVRHKPNAKPVRRVIANLFAIAARDHGNAAAKRIVAIYARSPCDYADETGLIIEFCRLMLRGVDPKRSAEANAEARRCGFGFLTETTRSLCRDLAELKTRHTHDSNSAWAQEDIERYQTIYVLAHAVAIELYFGSGAYATEEDVHHQGEPAAPELAEKVQILNESLPLLEELSGLECVHAAYYTLKTLAFLSDIDPKQILLLSARLVRGASVDGIQRETLAADLVVAIVERYLAGYADLLRTDAEARAALLDLLDVFVAVGWPSAVRLTHRLVDIFR